MATKKTIKNKALISKTEVEIQAEQLDLKVEQAELNFSQGILSLKSKMIYAEGDVKKHQANVKTAETHLENSKSSNPEKLVQNLVDAKVAVKQAQLNLQSSQESYNELKEIYDFLEKTKEELF